MHASPAAVADPQRAAFVKTAKASMALRYRGLALDDVAELPRSPVHERRFTALEVLVAQYEHAGQAGREKIFEFYLQHLSGVNNWDLVDTSAPFIVGAHPIHKRSRRMLDLLAGSANLWIRRVAIVSTLCAKGKGSRAALLSFLREHYGSLPRTTLRYAIERFPPDRRKRNAGRRFRTCANLIHRIRQPLPMVAAQY